MNMRRILGAVVTAGAITALLTGTASAAPAPVDPNAQVAATTADGVLPNAPDPGAKAHSPETNLAQFPKRTGAVPVPTAAQNAAAKKAAPEKQVYEVTKDANGVALSLFDPADGVTPDQLAASLKAKGHKDVVASTEDPGLAVAKAQGTVPQDAQPDAALSPQAVDPAYWANCNYITARTVACPVGYWTNNGLTHPNVRFNDHAGAAWPTDTVVYTWNTTQGIDSSYLWNSCPFKAGARCVDVYDADYGADGYAGYAHLFWPNGTGVVSTGGPGGPFAEQGNWVELNDHYEAGKNANVHLAVETHELGHILGLGHNTCSCDVMRGTALDGETNPPSYPSSDDFNQLAELYSVYH
jgi:hypothetical protein